MVDVIARRSTYIGSRLVDTMRPDLTNSRTPTSKMLPAIMQMFNQRQTRHFDNAPRRGALALQRNKKKKKKEKTGV